jgi:hypothetical protein
MDDLHFDILDVRKKRQKLFYICVMKQKISISHPHITYINTFVEEQRYHLHLCRKTKVHSFVERQIYIPLLKYKYS